MPETKRTQRKWQVEEMLEPNQWGVYCKGYGYIARMMSGHEEGKANAQFIVTACNAHDELIGLLSTILHAIPSHYTDAQAARKLDVSVEIVRLIKQAVNDAGESK